MQETFFLQGPKFLDVFRMKFTKLNGDWSGVDSLYMYLYNIRVYVCMYCKGGEREAGTIVRRREGRGQGVPKIKGKFASRDLSTSRI